MRIPAQLRAAALAGLMLGCMACVVSAPASAEPWFAIDTGHRCVACHVNPTGGGKRTPYGNAFGQMQLPASMPEKFWDPRFAEQFSLGGDVRVNAVSTRIPNQDNRSSFDVEEALVYVEFALLENKLTLYADQRIGPGGSTNREAYALMWFNDRSWYVKAGRLFLPYGWRLEDDSEFIRQVPGINYATPDDGVEIGLEYRNASLSLAVTNGVAGGNESDTGKQFSLAGTYVQNRWRAGASFNYNDADSGDRRMQNVYAGLRTGPVNWLGQVDYIVDDGTPTGRRKQLVSFLEANVAFRQGHNLKFTYGYFDPDDDVDEDERNRYSIVWEYFPAAFTQFSLGARISEGIPQNDNQNTDEVFAQLHIYY